MSSLYVLRAATLAQIGRLGEAGTLIETALGRPDLRSEPDLVLEAAEYEDSYGEPSASLAPSERGRFASRLVSQSPIGCGHSSWLVAT